MSDTINMIRGPKTLQREEGWEEKAEKQETVVRVSKLANNAGHRCIKDLTAWRDRPLGTLEGWQGSSTLVCLWPEQASVTGAFPRS